MTIVGELLRRRYMLSVAGRYCPCEWPVKIGPLVRLCGCIDDSFVRDHSAVDRFICRREGHVPSMTIMAGAEFIVSYISTCSRCGKYVEVKGEYPSAEDAL